MAVRRRFAWMQKEPLAAPAAPAAPPPRAPRAPVPPAVPPRDSVLGLQVGDLYRGKYGDRVVWRVAEIDRVQSGYGRVSREIVRVRLEDATYGDGSFFWKDATSLREEYDWIGYQAAPSRELGDDYDTGSFAAPLGLSATVDAEDYYDVYEPDPRALDGESVPCTDWRAYPDILARAACLIGRGEPPPPPACDQIAKLLDLGVTANDGATPRDVRRQALRLIMSVLCLTPLGAQVSDCALVCLATAYVYMNDADRTTFVEAAQARLGRKEKIAREDRRKIDETLALHFSITGIRRRPIV